VNRSNQPSTDDDWSIKADHQINSRQRVSFSHWSADGNTQINGAVAASSILDSGHAYHSGRMAGQSHLYGHTNVVKSRRIRYTPTSPTWSRWKLDPREGNKVLQIPGIPQTSRDSRSSISPGPRHTPAWALKQQWTDPQFFQNWSGSDDVAWVKGSTRSSSDSCSAAVR